MALPHKGKQRHKKKALLWRKWTKEHFGPFKSERGAIDWGRKEEPEPPKGHAISAHIGEGKIRVVYPSGEVVHQGGERKRKSSGGKKQ